MRAPRRAKRSATRASLRSLGFTLLEVLVAVAILGLALSSIFASEAGAIKVANRARRTSYATVLARCKLGEIEEKVMKEGLPAVSASDTDECCDGAEIEGFACDWSIERIVLPDSTEQEGGTLEDGAPGAAGGEDPLGGQSIESMMSGGGASMGGLAEMAMSYTYPVLKSTIEEQVRRVTVTVRWQEGTQRKSFDVVQYLVADASMIAGTQDAIDNLINGPPPGGH
jgi:general secretion pathway protein I